MEVARNRVAHWRDRAEKAARKSKGLNMGPVQPKGLLQPYHDALPVDFIFPKEPSDAEEGAAEQGDGPGDDSLDIMN